MNTIDTANDDMPIINIFECSGSFRKTPSETRSDNNGKAMAPNIRNARCILGDSERYVRKSNDKPLKNSSKAIINKSMVDTIG
ncbi:MAG: hypothetical protein ACFN20_01620 [Bacteroidota bacterium]